MNNIEFSIVNNQARTKFKIAWNVKLGDYPMTKVMSREFPTEAAAQEYIDKNREKLTQIICERISKIAINIKEEKKEEVETLATEEVVEEKTEEVVEETTEEVVEENIETPVEADAEVVDELASDLPETEENTEENTEEVVEEETPVTAVVPYEETALVPVDEEKVVRTPNRKVKIVKRTIAGILALVITIIGISHIVKHSKKDELPSDEPGITDTDNPETDEVVEGLTTEEFTNLVANLAKIYQDKNVDLTTEDITQFVAIINIDDLTQDNKELASELFANSTKEEYIQNAAKTISETVMYNAKVFEEEKSTENFIRISDALYGESKESLVVIESYVDEIAKVYYDKEQVNELVSELITRLVTGDLNTLDNGAQFGMQISIELIRSYIAKDVLTNVNKDVLTDITRLDVSGIMNTYDSVNGLGNAKTLK